MQHSSTRRGQTRGRTLLDLLGSSSSSSSDEESSSGDTSRSKITTTSTTTVSSVPITPQKLVITGDAANASTPLHAAAPVTGIVVRRRRLPNSRGTSASQSATHSPFVGSPGHQAFLSASSVPFSGGGDDSSGEDALLAALHNPAVSRLHKVEDEGTQSKKSKKSGKKNQHISSQPAAAAAATDVEDANRQSDAAIDEEDPLDGIARAAAEMHESWYLYYKNANPSPKFKLSMRAKWRSGSSTSSPSPLIGEIDESAQGDLSHIANERDRMLANTRHQLDWMRMQSERLYNHDMTPRGTDEDADLFSEGAFWVEDNSASSVSPVNPLNSCSVFMDHLNTRKHCTTVSEGDWHLNQQTAVKKKEEQIKTETGDDDDDDDDDDDMESYLSAEEDSDTD